jgi:hypothetical protein
VAKSLFVNPKELSMSNLQANIECNITIVLNPQKGGITVVLENRMKLTGT